MSLIGLVDDWLRKQQDQRETRELPKEARRRLLEWSNDDLYVVRSVRFHEPVYANPGELRADVLTLLAECDRLEKRSRRWVTG